MPNLINLKTLEYPVSVQEFKRRHAQVSFSTPIRFDEFGYEVVFDAPPPAHDAVTQRAREKPPAKTAKGTWQQQWEIVDLDAEAIAASAERKAQEASDAAKAELAANDLKIIRALTEGDTARIEAHKILQAALRAKLQ